MGGRSDDGIMSVRREYDIGGKVKNFFTPDPSKGTLGQRGINLLKRAYNLFPEEGLLSKGARNFPGTTSAIRTTGLMGAPFILPAAIGASNYPVYPKGHPKEGEFMPLDEAKMVIEESGDAGTAADIEGEAAMFDLDLPESSGGKMDIYGNKKYATKLDFDSPQVIENSIELGILPETTDDDTTDDDTANKVSFIIGSRSS